MDTLLDILSDDPARDGVALVATVVFYGHIVLLMRLSGKRSLAQMTAFDFIRMSVSAVSLRRRWYPAASPSGGGWPC